jgi:hypothetical protein
VVDLQAKVLGLLRRAERARNFNAALGAIREARNLLELHGRLTGQITPDGVRVAVQVNTRGTEAVRSRVLTKLAALAGGQKPVMIEGKSELPGVDRFGKCSKHGFLPRKGFVGVVGQC